MKTTNIFYPNAIIWLYNKLYYKICDQFDKNIIYDLFLCLVLGSLSTYVILLLPVWYIGDVIGNILYWIGMKLFVNLPLWGLNRAEEINKHVALISKEMKEMDDCNEVMRNCDRKLFSWKNWRKK